MIVGLRWCSGNDGRVRARLCGTVHPAGGFDTVYHASHYHNDTRIERRITRVTSRSRVYDDEDGIRIARARARMRRNRIPETRRGTDDDSRWSMHLEAVDERYTLRRVHRRDSAAIRTSMQSPAITLPSLPPCLPRFLSRRIITTKLSEEPCGRARKFVRVSAHRWRNTRARYVFENPVSLLLPLFRFAPHDRSTDRDWNLRLVMMNRIAERRTDNARVFAGPPHVRLLCSRART